MSWWLVGLSLFVSNVGNATFLGIAGAASSRGFPVIAYEFSAVFCLLMLGNLFMPVYLASGVFTMPQYIQRRYGGNRLSIFLAITMLIAGVTANLCGEMYAGIILIQQTLGWPLYVSLCAILLMTAIYTMSGGLTAVVYTDALQSVIIIIGSLILTVIAFVHIGVTEFPTLYMEAIPNETRSIENNSCGVPQESDWHIFHPADDPQYPWPGVGFGIILLSSYYWCTNQVIVQRSLASKNLNHAKGGSILASYLKILPILIMVYPGMISRALFPDEVACQSPETCLAACGNPKGCADIAYPKLLVALMPTGLKGLMLAAMLAALVSTMTSIFNSLSTLFTMDIWTKMRSSPSDIELLVVGRVTTAVVAVVAVLWLPIIQSYGAGELFFYIQSIASYLYPPVFAIFIVGILWERATEKGAFAALVSGVLLGAARFTSDFFFDSPGCGQVDTRPGITKKLPFLHFALLLFGICLFVIILVSLLTEPMPKEKLVRLTWWTRNVPRTKDRPTMLNQNTSEKESTAETVQTEVREPSPRGKLILKYLCCITERFDVSAEDPESNEDDQSQKKEVSKVKEWILNINIVVCFIFGVVVYILFG
ncbi:sodium/myo-inositol cotransporter 2-like isoform X2 [Apostichopus japonicus]